jgi:hypothetical protein
MTSTLSTTKLFLTGIGIAGALTAGSEVAAQTVQQRPAGCNLCWAVVEDNGTIRRDEGLLAAVRVDDGEYTLTFSARVNNCAANATIDGSDDEPGEITVRTQGGGANFNRLFVETFDSDGENADRGFHVSINC